MTRGRDDSSSRDVRVFHEVALSQTQIAALSVPDWCVLLSAHISRGQSTRSPHALLRREERRESNAQIHTNRTVRSRRLVDELEPAPDCGEARELGVRHAVAVRERGERGRRGETP